MGFFNCARRDASSVASISSQRILAPFQFFRKSSSDLSKNIIRRKRTLSKNVARKQIHRTTDILTTTESLPCRAPAQRGRKRAELHMNQISVGLRGQVHSVHSGDGDGPSYLRYSYLLINSVKKLKDGFYGL